MADDVLVIRVGDPAPQVVGNGFDQAPSAIFVPLPQGPPGPQGPAGPPGGARFGMDFTAANPVVVPHNLGVFPHVTVIVGGDEVDADISYGSLNQVTLSFAGPTTGRVEVS